MVGVRALVLWKAVHRRSDYSKSTPHYITAALHSNQKRYHVQAAILFRMVNGANDGSPESEKPISDQLSRDTLYSASPLGYMLPFTRHHRPVHATFCSTRTTVAGDPSKH